MPAMRMLFARTEYGRPYFLPPDVPAPRVQALRRAFDATMKDPEFLDEARRTSLTVNPLAGEELQKLVAEVSALTPDLLEKVRAAYSAKSN